MLEVQDANMTDFYTTDVDMSAEEWSRVADAEMSDRDEEENNQSEEVNMEPVEITSPEIVDEEFINGEATTLPDEEVFDSSTLHSPMPDYPSLSAVDLRTNEIQNVEHVLQHEVVWDTSGAPEPSAPENNNPIQSSEAAILTSSAAVTPIVDPNEQSSTALEPSGVEPVSTNISYEKITTNEESETNNPLPTRDKDHVTTQEETHDDTNEEESENSNEVALQSEAARPEHREEDSSADVPDVPKVREDVKQPETNSAPQRPTEEPQDDEVDPSPSILVSFPSADVLFYLFRPPHEHPGVSDVHDTDDDNQIPVLFQNRQLLCREPLSELFETLRGEDGFSEHIGDAELVINCTDLGLEIGEDNRLTAEVSAADLDILHTSKQIDGPLKMELRLNTNRFATRFKRMMEQIHRDVEASDHEYSDESTEEAGEAEIAAALHEGTETDGGLAENADKAAQRTHDSVVEPSVEDEEGDQAQPDANTAAEDAKALAAAQEESEIGRTDPDAEPEIETIEDHREESSHSQGAIGEPSSKGPDPDSKPSPQLRLSLITRTDSDPSALSQVSGPDDEGAEDVRSNEDEEDEDAEGIDEQEYYDDTTLESTRDLRSKRTFADVEEGRNETDTEKSDEFDSQADRPIDTKRLRTG